MMLQSYILQFRKQLVKKIRRGYFDKLKRLLLLLLPLSLLCACTTAPAEQADAPFSFYYRCAEVAFGGEDGVIRAEAAPLEPDAESAHRRASIPEGARLAGAAHSPARQTGRWSPLA